jgi:hypothetical protein
MDQFNTLIFAVNQELNCRDVYEGDFGQVQDFSGAFVIHCRSNAFEIL